MVRHRNLDPTFKGSNPFSPATLIAFKNLVLVVGLYIYTLYFFYHVKKDLYLFFGRKDQRPHKFVVSVVKKIQEGARIKKEKEICGFCIVTQKGLYFIFSWPTYQLDLVTPKSNP